MEGSMNKRVFIALVIVGLVGIITLALAATILGILNKRFDALERKLQSTDTLQLTTTTTTRPLLNSILAESIHIEEIVQYLRSLQHIADTSSGNRAINTLGFNQTLDFISKTLANNTNFNVVKTFFPVRNFVIDTDPILISSTDGIIKNYTYSSNSANAEFMHVKYSTSSNILNVFRLTVIPDGGCTENDWQKAIGPTVGRIALVKRGGSCTFANRAAQAPKFNVTGVLFYNDGTLPDHLTPIEVSLHQDNALPVLFLSYTAGEALAIAALNTSINVTVQLGISLKNLPDFPVGNICADTPTGDVTHTIVVGSHSDSVPTGPGINDNGSGTAANLGLAVALARLFQTSTYEKYKYRIRFCWWGAEEVGLLGSKYHVKQAKSSQVIGERLTDYLINLNYDMLGSPNFMFGIYDGRTANNSAPPTALPGTNKITTLYRDWFIQQNLPWNYTYFGGGSDYAPFLAEGIVAGGLFSGADDTKSKDERDYYDQMLGQGMGGIAGAIHDPCYHRACDSIQNINVFAYERMVQAVAYILEYVARQDDLKAWLYPTSRI